jgi:hypothetical protein
VEKLNEIKLHRKFVAGKSSSRVEKGGSKRAGSGEIVDIANKFPPIDSPLWRKV